MTYPRIIEDFVVNFGKKDPRDFRFYGVCVEQCPQPEDIVCNDEGTTLKEQTAQAALTKCLVGESGHGVSNCDILKQNCWVTPPLPMSSGMLLLHSFAANVYCLHSAFPLHSSVRAVRLVKRNVLLARASAKQLGQHTWLCSCPSGD